MTTKFIRNSVSIQDTIVNVVFIKNQTVISCIFQRSASENDNVAEHNSDFSSFNFENLNSMTKENESKMITDIPEDMKKMFLHTQLGCGLPGYYYCSGIIKFTKGNPTNKSIFDMKGPQQWFFEFSNGKYTRVYNLFPYTSISRDIGNSYTFKERCISTMIIQSPLQNSSLEDCIFLLNCETSFPENKDVKIVPWERSLKSYIPIPKIKMESLTVDSNELVRGTIEVVDAAGEPVNAEDSEVFLEVTAGNLNKTRFIVGKDISFKIRATDLGTDDHIRVKAGWRNYEGLSEAIITVK